LVLLLKHPWLRLGQVLIVGNALQWVPLRGGLWLLLVLKLLVRSLILFSIFVEVLLRL
jgi:hypothetical protein